MNTSPTTENRIWAVLSHLSALTFGMGILLPIIGWSDQRRKSRYASFQTLQALGYQSLGFTVWILSYLVIAILAAIIVLIITGARDGSENPDTAMVPWAIVFSVVMLGFLALYLLLPVIAALACALGKDFRYPILGNRLARYLGYDPTQKAEEQAWLVEDHEFRWVAAMGHISILILIWGMLAPLTAWILYGKRSLFLKFQSIQTLVYQAVVTIFYFAGTFLYIGGLFAVLVATGTLGLSESSSSIGIVGIVIFGAMLALGGVIILVIPVFHILGQWAGYRVLKGDNYHYPLVGRWVEKSLLSRLHSPDKIENESANLH
jgi:uncharacterized Tic20 family protein